VEACAEDRLNSRTHSCAGDESEWLQVCVCMMVCVREVCLHVYVRASVCVGVCRSESEKGLSKGAIPLELAVRE